MTEKTLFTIDTPYRRSLPVKGWYFGDPEKKTLAVIGALRGNEIQQMHICARLVQTLEALEKENRISPDCGILVIPCANQFSMNVGRRFWAADNTDINRMFPGYALGETTQRIAARIFESLQGYDYGVHFTSFYLPGDLLPHVRIIETGYENPQAAAAFGLPYILLRKPQPYDTTTLNYNWQIWNTQAFSVYTRGTESIIREDARLAVMAVLRFLSAQNKIDKPFPDPAQAPVTLQEARLHTVHSTAGGLLVRSCQPGDAVPRGGLLGEILDPCTCRVLEELRADCPGRVFFTHRAQLINGHEAAFRILPENLF